MIPERNVLYPKWMWFPADTTSVEHDVALALSALTNSPNDLTKSLALTALDTWVTGQSSIVSMVVRDMAWGA